VLLGLVACLATVSGSFSPPLVGGAARERIEARLGRELGAPAALEGARFEVLAAGLVLLDVRIPLESWRLHVPRLVIRPRLAPLLRGRLQLAASADGFALVGEGADGAALARRLPELLDALGLPDAEVRLRGGELRAQEGGALLAPLGVALDVEGDDARLAVRARQRTGGRLDLRGTIRRGGAIRVNAYLDDLATDDVGPWLAALRGPGAGVLELALERASVSGRWHASAGPRGAVAHEFALDLRATERMEAGGRGRARTSLHLAGRFGLDARATARAARAISAGTELVATGRAEQLRGRFGAGAGEMPQDFLLSGPFEVTVRPRGSTARASVAARARLDDAWLHALGLRKPAGTSAWLDLLAETGPGSATRVAVTGALGALALEAELGREGQLDARTDWVELASLAALVPELRGRAAGGRARIANLRAHAGEDWTALLELDGAELAGARMPFEVRALRGEARLGPDRVEVRDCEAEVAGVPLRFDLDALRGGPGPAARVRFAARVESIAWDEAAPAATLPGDAGAARGPGELAALGRLAEAPLRVLRELDLARRFEIERGRLRVARLRAGRERLRDLEIDLALRGTLLELRRVAYLRGDQRATWGGSIDLRGVVPDVELAALR
jgi:hypothetical protein